MYILSVSKSKSKRDARVLAQCLMLMQVQRPNKISNEKWATRNVRKHRGAPKPEETPWSSYRPRALCKLTELLSTSSSRPCAFAFIKAMVP